MLFTTLSFQSNIIKKDIKDTTMLSPKYSIFAKTRSLENKIDHFHDKLIDVSLVFKRIIKIYLKHKRNKDFTQLSKDIKHIEHDADTLRRDIENSLYTHNLIPDLRADVLHLVENLDKIINKIDEVTYSFYVEQPDIPEIYHERVLELCKEICECTQNTGMASRAFFRDISCVRDFSQKVYFIEHETDIICGKLKEEIFSSDLDLAHKIQLRNFLDSIADIADIAEDCIDELLIFAIKRDI